MNRLQTERKIIFLVNPISGTKKKTKTIQHIQHELQRQNIDFEILTTREDGDYKDISRKIKDEKFTDVIIVGGDGSVNQVVGSLKHLPLNFGIIPFGSGNGLARSLGIPKNSKAALKRILEGEATYIDAFTINEQFACMLAGLGLDAQVAHDFANSKSRGLITYVRKSIADFFKSKPYSFEIEINGISFSTEAYFISIANANQFGNNFKIAPKAKLNDGLLDIVVVQKMKKTKLIVAVINQITGKNKIKNIADNNYPQRVLYFQTASIKIFNKNEAPLHIDGEPKPTFSQINVDILPKCYKMIY